MTYLRREIKFSAGPDVDGVADFEYRTSEPFAVVVTMRPGQGQVWPPVRLRLWRDHVAAGLVAYPGNPAVVGWARMWSTQRLFWLRWDTGMGAQLVKLSNRKVGEFVTETARMVPAGEEHAGLDLPVWVYRDGAR